MYVSEDGLSLFLYANCRSWCLVWAKVTTPSENRILGRDADTRFPPTFVCPAHLDYDRRIFKDWQAAARAASRWASRMDVVAYYFADLDAAEAALRAAELEISEGEV